MGVFRDLTGQRFGYLTVFSRGPNKGTCAIWNCRCDCGKEVVRISADLNAGRYLDCGCQRGTHRHTASGKISPTYSSWTSMIARCTQPSSAGFAHYQKLGITVCARWRVFDNFLADMGERPSRLYSLDRYPDQKGNYEPGNCRWATRREQANNRTTNKLFEFQGEMLTYREVARRTGLSDELLRHRLLRANWSVERAVSSEQVPGKRPYETITDLAIKAGVPPRVFAERLREGWSIERAGSPVRARARS